MQTKANGSVFFLALHISGRLSLDLQQTIVCVLQRWTVKIASIVDVRRADTVDDGRLIGVNAEIVTEAARVPVSVREIKRTQSENVLPTSNDIFC